MKKLLLLLLLGMTSCLENRPVAGTIITDIQLYSGTNNVLYTTENQGKFWAPIGLYNVGDTVHFIKR